MSAWPASRRRRQGPRAPAERPSWGPTPVRAIKRLIRGVPLQHRLARPLSDSADADDGLSAKARAIAAAICVLARRVDRRPRDSRLRGGRRHRSRAYSDGSLPRRCRREGGSDADSRRDPGRLSPHGARRHQRGAELRRRRRTSGVVAKLWRCRPDRGACVEARRVPRACRTRAQAMLHALRSGSGVQVRVTAVIQEALAKRDDAMGKHPRGCPAADTRRCLCPTEISTWDARLVIARVSTASAELSAHAPAFSNLIAEPPRCPARRVIARRGPEMSATRQGSCRPWAARSRARISIHRERRVRSPR
jgi:hypothetical protein